MGPDWVIWPHFSAQEGSSQNTWHTWDCIQMVLEYLHWGTLQNSSGQSLFHVQPLHSTEVFLIFRWNVCASVSSHFFLPYCTTGYSLVHPLGTLRYLYRRMRFPLSCHFSKLNRPCFPSFSSYDRYFPLPIIFVALLRSRAFPAPSTRGRASSGL